MNCLDIFGLEEKVAIITGGSSGIGLASALRLSQFGAHVAILDVNDEAGASAVSEIEERGGRARYFHCDVTSAEMCQDAVRNITAQFGRIDVLFNNAGVIRRRSVVDLPETDWDLVIDVCLKGVYMLSKYVIPVMANGGGGSIVNTSSGWGLKGGDNAAAYCAAKAGVVNLTKAMAIDHGRQNIRVNSVAPGDTDTPLLRDEAKQLQQEEQSFLVSSAQGRPLERLGTPADIADAVLFLSSKLAAWVTGSVLVVDGGGLA